MAEKDKKAKILLCEDDPNLGSVLKNYLELNDYDVTLGTRWPPWPCRFSKGTI